MLRHEDSIYYVYCSRFFIITHYIIEGSFIGVLPGHMRGGSAGTLVVRGPERQKGPVYF